ncbi:MAG: trans-sulfuration enzyme family protein [Vulcanimicrobiaceae bacterium]
MRFSTRAIHVGQEADKATGATIVPIYQTSTFTQTAVGENRGYLYSRAANPTRTALEAQLASLEGGAHCSAFASGMAAIAAVCNGLLNPGDHLLLCDDLYGGSYRFFSRILARAGYAFSFADFTDLDAVRAALQPRTKIVWLETPTNPLLRIVDVAALAELRPPGAVLVTDNTFASPYLQNPLELGSDVVVHSTTKYIGGHSDVLGGAAVSNDPELAESIKFQQYAVGAVPGPLDAWLIMRGAKTLAVRMREQQRSAQAIAEFLAASGEVEAVNYPGLPSHPQHALAQRQMRGFGGMLSFRLSGPETRALAFAKSTRLFSLGVSLGGIESLIEHPARQTHASMPPEEQARRGIAGNLLRLSVGLEDSGDLIDDLRAAVAASRLAPRG